MLIFSLDFNIARYQNRSCHYHSITWKTAQRGVQGRAADRRSVLWNEGLGGDISMSEFLQFIWNSPRLSFGSFLRGVENCNKLAIAKRFRLNESPDPASDVHVSTSWLEN